MTMENKRMKNVTVLITCLMSLNTLGCYSAANAVDTRVGAEAVQTSQEPPAISAVSSHLTSGDWGYTIGEGPLTTTYMYTFSSDGIYTLRILTDYNTDPEKGE